MADDLGEKKIHNRNSYYAKRAKDCMTLFNFVVWLGRKTQHIEQLENYKVLSRNS